MGQFAVKQVGQFVVKHPGQYQLKQVGHIQLKYLGQFKVKQVGQNEVKFPLAEGNLHNPLSEPADGERYFYHSDHLGSSAFITTENGYATQFLAYMPFGETLNEEQNSSNYYSPFKFSAKEKDPETGYSYFGARYYSHELSIWLSVDPLADHPNQVDKSPYAAFWNNPVKYNDPDGRCPVCEEEMPDAPMNTVYRPEGSSLDWVKGADGQWTGLGGDLNEVSVTASPLQSGETRDAQGGGSTWDPVTNDRISQLDSRLQGPATQFINQVESDLGVQLRITQGFRSFAEQDALYAKGRTAPGNIVTNARGGQSYHNYGLAFDVVVMQNGQPVWTPLPANIGAIGVGLGFEWGGNWSSFKDYPHFQMTFGHSIQQLQGR